MTTDGSAQQLPRLGLLSWENTVPAANRSDSTVVIGAEDAGPNTALPNPDDAAGQLRIYSGTKTRRGNAFTRAGLTNGVNSVLDVADESVTNDAGFRAKYGKGNPAEVDLSEVDWDQSASAQNLEATRRRAQPQPHRGWRLRSPPPRRLLLPHHGGRRHVAGRRR